VKALILGVLGQDGSYLAEQLLADGHEVHGVVRRSNVVSPVPLVWADLLDQDSLERVLLEVEPDVVFNLAAVTSPGGAWGNPQPPLLADVTGLGVLRLLDAMVSSAPDARLVHASSSSIYDLARYGVYGAAKAFAHEAVVGYRDTLHCSNAVLFSHTSPRQDPRFLARRICTTLASGERLNLTDVESRRDWGHARDYMKAFRAIADLPPGDYQIRTGETHSVRELVDVALDTACRGWDVVTTDPTVKVPDEIVGDHPIVPGWKPDTAFEDMVRELVHA
jgi:GDPmannose 4,6-dehydratase